MKLMEFIAPDAVLPSLAAETARAVIDEMVGHLVTIKALAKKDHAKVVEAVLRREKKGTTGFGNGVAIPHAKHEGIKGVVGLVARSAAGIDFASLDREPVRLFFLLLSNPDQPEQHLKAMEHIFRSIKNDHLRRFMCQASTREELVDLLREADEEMG
ncbi:MAG TPA: PTS sugar transporter subunit IIA [Phycisphaerae bacterium]|nr:PTS sugar transporter subunit IIA [Phycisphaerae bacterium]